MQYKTYLKQAKERRRAIFNDHLLGMSYSQLAKKYDVIPARIGHIVKKEREEVANEQEEKGNGL